MSEADMDGPPPSNNKNDDGPPSEGRRSRSPPRRYNRRSRSRSYSPENRHRGPRPRSRSRSPPRRYRGDSPPRRSYSPDRNGRGGGYGPPPGREPYREGGPGPYGRDYEARRGGPYDRPYDDRPPYDDRRRGPPGPPPPYGRGGPPPPMRGGGRGPRGSSIPGVSLLVRNVSPAITTADLQRAFGRIGEIRDVYIPRDYHSQQPKGFAFIEYATEEQAQEARDEMDRFVIKGRELEVVFAQEKRKTPGEMRGRVVNQQNRGGDRSNFERSSSYERHRREQERHNRGGPRDADEPPPMDRRPPNDGDDRRPGRDEP